MRGRTAIAAGLLTGVLAGAAALGAAVALYPSPSPGPGSTTDPTAVPSPTATASPSAVSPTPSPAPSAPIESPASGLFGVGAPAPELAVDRLGGGEIDLAALRGSPVWVYFMASWCPECRDELPLLNGFAVRHADDGLVILAIDVREDEGTIAAFFDGRGVTFPVGLDTDGAAEQAWRALALPVHFWVDAEGIVRDGALGGIGGDVMAAGLRAIMPGVEVDSEP